MEALKDRVRSILADTLEIRKEDIHPEDKLTDDLGADSLHKVEFVMALENAFEIEIPETEAQKIVSMQDAVEYIRAHLPPP